MEPRQPKVQRILTTFSSHTEREEKERSEWRAMTPLQRLCAVEVMRQLNHPGYDSNTTRLQRFYSVA